MSAPISNSATSASRPSFGSAGDDAAHRQARRVRFDVEHRRLEAGRLGQALAVLDAVLARRGDQDLDVADRGRARPDDAEVEADLVERERDVLVGFGLDLHLELFFAQAGRQHDLLGDHGRLRHRHHDLAGARAALADDALDRFGDLVELLDLAVGDPALFEALGAETLEDVLAAAVLPELHQLDARRADVEADHRRVLAAQQRVKKAHDTPSTSRENNVLDC